MWFNSIGYSIKNEKCQFSHRIWNLTNFRVFLAELRPNLRIFAKLNSKIYSFFCFLTNSIQTFIQFSFCSQIQFKTWLNFLFPDKIQFKNLFKILKLAVFNSIKYSFNKKTRVLDMASIGSHTIYSQFQIFTDFWDCGSLRCLPSIQVWMVWCSDTISNEDFHYAALSLTHPVCITPEIHQTHINQANYCYDFC